MLIEHYVNDDVPLKLHWLRRFSRLTRQVRRVPVIVVIIGIAYVVKDTLSLLSRFHYF